ncbi:MAG: hypothetical protein RJA34_1520 [Pseudomonadota bacterium]|jgi:long-chain fatty acid transport protein
MRSTHSASATRLLPIAAALLLGGTLSTAYATNGMLMEGYGPIATGMGGASQAYDNGTGAMAQNPATLALMSDGAHLDVAVGVLGPDVSSSMMGMTAKSGGTSYVMPALGYMRRSGALTFGLGVFAQGGMGTEYAGDSFIANPGVSSGLPARSELGVGNVIFPVSLQVDPKLTVGAALKFIWSSLDMAMTVPFSMFSPAPGGLITGGTMNPSAFGPASAATIKFSDQNDFTGAAKSTGFGLTLGGTYKVDNALTLGGSYQMKSALGDMQTSGSGASISLDGNLADTGKISVIDFQMPSVLAFGASLQANPDLLLAADVKRIGWANSMKSFKMRYTTAMDPSGGSYIDFALPQNWKDQTVLSLGAAWKANEQLTLRAGLNLANNPVPDSTVNPLFPAIVKNHVTFGFGYKASAQGALNASMTIAPSVKVTSGTGIDISHSQTNVQLMYSHSF